MTEVFRKIHFLLEGSERRNAMLLFGMIVVMGMLETIGVASVMPFMSVVANREAIVTNEYLATAYSSLGFTSVETFLVALGGAVFVLVVASLAFKALTHFVMARFVHMRSYSLSSRLLRAYLGQPYSFFLNRHSAALSTSVLSEVDQVVNQALMPAMKVVANTIVAAFLITLIVAVDPTVAVSAVVLLGGSYALIYVVLRRYISRIGAKRMRANRVRFQMAQEALGGIKDVKVLGLEDGYVFGFRRPAREFAKTQANNQIVGELPKFALQALMFGGMLLLLVGLLLTRQGTLEDVFPIVGLYAVAGARLIPALEQVYRAVMALRFGKPALDNLHKDLTEAQKAVAPKSPPDKSAPPKPIRLERLLQLDCVDYTYPGAGRAALSDLSISITARTTVAIVGSTGAGKTTAVDLILGLLEPQRGQLVVDGQPITDKNRRAWQRSIGYVPQSIFLTDDTVAANIAFGIPHEEIDQTAVEHAARLSELHRFIIEDTPKGYDTLVGERGVRLSGGQRQRIGIARALYHDPDVLVLDEATSALDTLTERGVMAAIKSLGHRKTIIIIAHRLSTVRHCDSIFLLYHGKLDSQGTYEELLSTSNHFRSMSAAAT